MRRREFVLALGGAATVWPLVARAQQPAMPVVGFLNSSSPGIYAPMVAAFRQGLNDGGYIEGRNITIEYRWAENQPDRLPAMMSDLVQRKVAVIAATSTPASLAAKAATSAIPVVFATGGDPVRLGLVSSLNRPGGNVTGATFLAEEVVPKLLELIHEVLPTARVIALLINPTDAATAEPNTSKALAAAHTLGLELQLLNASRERDLEEVFAKLGALRAGGLVIGPDPFFFSRREQIVALAARQAVPTCYFSREFAGAGGLMSYSSKPSDAYRQAGIYAGKILKGEKPADLPVMQPTKFELVINRKTAKALSLDIPPTLLARADEVIE